MWKHTFLEVIKSMIFASSGKLTFKMLSGIKIRISNRMSAKWETLESFKTYGFLNVDKIHFWKTFSTSREMKLNVSTFTWIFATSQNTLNLKNNLFCKAMENLTKLMENAWKINAKSLKNVDTEWCSLRTLEKAYILNL